MSRWYAWIAAELRVRLAAGRLPEGAGRLAVIAVSASAALVALLWQVLGGYHARFLQINQLLAPLPAPLVQVITYFGDTLPALCLLLMCARRAPQRLWIGTLSALVATVLSRVPKALLDTDRPPATLAADSFRLIGPHYMQQSFPSGHATTAFVTAAVFAWGLRDAGRRCLLFTLASLVALSRVAAGVHWPVDVLAGAAIGSFSVLVGAALARRWPIGDRPAIHLTLVLILAGCAASLLAIRIPYPDATVPARLLAVTALALTTWDYLWIPLRRQRGRDETRPWWRRRDGYDQG